MKLIVWQYFSVTQTSFCFKVNGLQVKECSRYYLSRTVQDKNLDLLNLGFWKCHATEKYYCRVTVLFCCFVVPSKDFKNQLIASQTHFILYLSKRYVVNLINVE